MVVNAWGLLSGASCTTMFIVCIKPAGLESQRALLITSGVLSADDLVVLTGEQESPAVLPAGKEQKKSKKRKLLACIAVPESAVNGDDMQGAASPTKKRRKKEKMCKAAENSTAPASEQPGSLPVPAAHGTTANGLANAARKGGVTADAAKKKKKKKSKEGRFGPRAAAGTGDPVSEQPVAEAEPAAAEQHEKPEPVLEDAVPDPEPLKGDDAQQRGSGRQQQQQQQQQGAPGSGRAFQRVKAEEWLDKKVRAAWGSEPSDVLNKRPAGLTFESIHAKFWPSSKC